MSLPPVTTPTAPDPRNLAMEALHVTEDAALAAAGWLGRGDEQAADSAAVDAMHKTLREIDIDGTIRIGDNANGSDKLAAGAKAGSGHGPAVEVALLPLEGPTIVAKGEPNGLSLIAMTDGADGGFLRVPDIYMEKVAVGPGLPDGVVDLNREPGENLNALADAKGVKVGDLVVCVLDRPRHGNLIRQIRDAGARVMLIADGDVSGVIATTWLKSGIDAYYGIGGAPQGVLSAAALGCVGGQMQGRLVIRSEADAAAARAAGIADPDRVLSGADMARGDLTFAATGVTPGPMLDGVTYARGLAVTQSLVMRSRTGTLRFVEAHHGFAAAAREQH
jgi:fructose-1,6-bisphosphatase II / sedoheptulose-1,7-bisphosphatase